jgi:hypothetical protein
MSTMRDKLRAMWNSNGRTEAEAETFRTKARKMASDNGLDDFLTGLEKEADSGQGKAKGKANKAKASKAKPFKDDGRLRKIKVVVGKDARGRKKWEVRKTVSHAEMKAEVDKLRKAGHEVKTEVVK